MSFNASLVTADAFQVTPSDTTAISAYGFYVGVTGDVTVITSRGTTVLFKAVPAGVSIPLAISKVKSTGTTASQIVAYGSA